MKYKYKKSLLILVLNICIVISIFNVNVRAQEEYSLGVNENEEFVWQVTELDVFEFQQVLGFEPNIALGDQIRLIIRNIDSGSSFYDLTVEFWDYKMDWGQSGRIENLPMNRDPDSYDDYIFALTPVDDYLDRISESLGPEYSFTSNSISKVIRADTGRDYIRERVYDRRGIPISETLYEYTTGRVIIKIEGSSSSISFGFYFLGVTILALTATIFIFLRKKRINFN